MRLGIAGALEHSSPEEWAQRRVDLGCRCVNFPVVHAVTEELVDAYAAAAQKHDLLIAEVGAWCNPLSKDEKTRTEARALCIERLKLADKIGANCCVNVLGTWFEQWDGPYKENFSPEMWDDAVQCIQEIIDAVNPTNTYYTIEPMPWMVPSDPDEYLKLIEAVDRDRFAVHLDVVNMITSPKKYFFNEDFIEECFTKLGDKIRSCHVKDINLIPKYTWQVEEVACGQGTLNLEKYAEWAHKTNPDMPMIIEHLNEDQEYLDSLLYVQGRMKDYL